ncbi:MAG TPA: hypothetical protein VGC02_04245 [Methanobacterium sp.]
MKPELQGKLIVAMLVSIMAFGLGTGTVFVTGMYQTLDPTTTLNTTQQSDFPVIQNNNPNNNMNTNTSRTPSNPSTPSTPTDSGNGQSGGQSNQNNSPGTSNNTTRN